MVRACGGFTGDKRDRPRSFREEEKSDCFLDSLAKSEVGNSWLPALPVEPNLVLEVIELPSANAWHQGVWKHRHAKPSSEEHAIDEPRVGSYARCDLGCFWMPLRHERQAQSGAKGLVHSPE